MHLIPIAIAAFLATMVGGLFALYLRDRLHLVLGFSAGAIIAVAFFDLLPEAIELVEGVYEVSAVFTVAVMGFALYLMIDRFLLGHSHDHGGHHHGHVHSVQRRGMAGAASVSFHSFLDGMAIGLAFQVSMTLGTIVAVAVLTHNFSDGINTVGMILKSGGAKLQAFRWLAVDAIAPVLGIMSTLFFTVADSTLGLLLAAFAGFFLYISASDLIPESYHSHPKHWTTIATLVGMATLYIAIKLAGV